MTGNAPAAAELEAARTLLARLGITPELLARMTTSTGMPTFAEYIDQVEQAVGDGARRAYSSYWRRVRQVWGGRKLDEPTALEIKQLAEQTKTRAVVRANARDGRCAAEHMISALRCIYHHAVADGLIREADNPATRVPKPRRLASTRHGLPDTAVAEILHAAITTGNDPELDELLLRLHIQTACRRGGALALKFGDLAVEQCLIRLCEKGDTVRWQPVSPSLMHQLVQHAQQRGAVNADDQILRYRTGAPITHRRYDHLWQRLGRHLPWVAAQQVSAHWLRHTTLTWVERNFSYAIARAYAGHSSTNDAGTTATYVRGNLEEVASALSALTGEAHPLATRQALQVSNTTARSSEPDRLRA